MKQYEFFPQLDFLHFYFSFSLPMKSIERRCKSKCRNRLSRSTHFDYFRRTLRVSVWNNILNVNKHVLGEVNIGLAEIDWSKDITNDYLLTSPDS